MLDYNLLKRQFADRLAMDWDGRGRFESAAYKVCQYAYMQGVKDGMKSAGLDDDEVKRLIGLVG